MLNYKNAERQSKIIHFDRSLIDFYRNQGLKIFTYIK